MELNKNGRDSVRESVALKLRDIDFDPNTRIKFEGEEQIRYLEELLFDEKIDENGEKYKVLAFFYEGLCKLDLSNISFDNVSFFENGERVDLSNTNAHIDFTQSYEFFKEDRIKISNISFRNVDLTKSHLDLVTAKNRGEIFQTNLSNTGIDLNNVKATIYQSDLSNNDFSKLKLCVDKENSEFGLTFTNNEGLLIDFCDLSNSKANIELTSISNSAKSSFRTLINRGFLVGCFINDKLMRSKIDLTRESYELLKEYTIFKAQRINKILDLIDSQIPRDGGRINNKDSNSEEESN